MRAAAWSVAPAATPNAPRSRRRLAAAIFSDIELAFVQEAGPHGTLAVAFDVIYAGETWCRSVVWVEAAVAARLGHEEPAVIRAARDALLEALVWEALPVALQLRLTSEGVSLLDRGTPGPRF